MDTKALKAELVEAYPSVKFSVRKTRNNIWVGQVVEIRYNGTGMTNRDHAEIWAIGQIHQSVGYQVETKSITSEGVLV